MDLKTGKVLMKNKNEVYCSPNGNGGLYRALRDSKKLLEMKNKGVKYLQILQIDNILNKTYDKLMIGYLIKNNLDVVTKYMSNSDNIEKCGKHVLINDKPFIIENNEMNEYFKD